eukprot:TRINITY_DN30266_c0_g1_i1.p1 TRINITY_DN30266_c0_g1~~TRINITY_DN30266_c0_g1_i1.p1  ORF type:complete len:1058 (+),score=329.07 TRINITY_DN30266_c0_g1_i1:81-3176(+)
MTSGVEVTRASAEEKLTAFYRWREPPKVSEVSNLLDQYDGRYADMFAELGNLYPGCSGWTRARDAITDWLAIQGSKDPFGEGDKLLQDWHTKNPPTGDPNPVTGFFLKFYEEMDKKYKTTYFQVRMQLALLYERENPRCSDRLVAGVGAFLRQKQYVKKHENFLSEQREWYHFQKLRARRWARDYYEKHNPGKKRDVDMLIETPCYKGTDGLDELKVLLIQRYEPQRYVDLCTWSQLAPDVNTNESLQEFFRARCAAKISQIQEIRQAYPDFNHLCEELIDLYEGDGEGQSGYAAKWKAQSPRLWPPWRHADYPKEHYPEGAPPNPSDLKIPTKGAQRPRTDFPDPLPFPLRPADRKELEKEIKRAAEERKLDHEQRLAEQRAEIEAAEGDARKPIREEEAEALPALAKAHADIEGRLAEFRKERAKQLGAAREQLEEAEKGPRKERLSEEAKARDGLLEQAAVSKEESLKRERERVQKEGGAKAALAAEEAGGRGAVAAEESGLRERLREFAAGQRALLEEGIDAIAAGEADARPAVEKDEAGAWAELSAQGVEEGASIAARDAVSGGQEQGRESIAAAEAAAWAALQGLQESQREERAAVEAAEEEARGCIDREGCEGLAARISWARSATQEWAAEREAIDAEEAPGRGAIESEQDAAWSAFVAGAATYMERVEGELRSLSDEEIPGRRAVAAEEAEGFAAVTRWARELLAAVEAQQRELTASEAPGRRAVASEESASRRELAQAMDEHFRRIAAERQGLVSAEGPPRRAIDSSQSKEWRELDSAIAKFVRVLQEQQQSLVRDEASARWRAEHDAGAALGRMRSSFASWVASIMAPRKALVAREESIREAIREEEETAFGAVMLSKRETDAGAVKAMLAQCSAARVMAASSGNAIQRRHQLLSNLEARLLLPRPFRTTAPPPGAVSLGPGPGATLGPRLRQQTGPPAPVAPVVPSPRQRQQTVGLPVTPPLAGGAPPRRLGGKAVAAAASALRPGGAAAARAASAPPSAKLPEPPPPPVQWPPTAVTEL